MQINDNMGFEELKLRLSTGMDEWPGSETTHIEVWQIHNGELNYYLGNLWLPEKIISKKEALDKLEKEFGAKLSLGETYTQVYTVAVVYDKRFEVFDWINSIEVMNKLAGE